MLEIDLKGRTALVTGATQGIGKSIIKQFIEAGANILATGTKTSEVEELNNLNSKMGSTNIHFIQLDLSDELSIINFLSEIETYPQIDICVNNAGVNRISKFTETDNEDFVWINQINFQGPYRILKAIAPKMINNKYGRIVNLASIWSVVTRKGRSLYTGSKHALVGLTKTLSVELAEHNILVNAVSPGFTLTELTKRTNSETDLSAIESTIPVGRMADPDEIANLIVYLCSDLNSYLTGQNIIIDGGFTNL